MSTFVLGQTALQINQAIATAYSGLVLAGTGLVRTNGDQNISGKKTFHGAVDFTGYPINFTGVSSFIPFSNASTDIGSASKMFKTGFFSGVTGYTGYFENLKVGNLITTLVPSLVNVTGNNMTLSGTTNIVNANVSGNLGVTGNLSVTGAATLSNNVSLLGTVYATGNKTFSGVFNQSGDVNIYGKTFVSGNSTFTGNVNITGNLSLTGNINIIGSLYHTGQHFINSDNNPITLTGAGGSHVFRIFAPTYLSGTMNHSGNMYRTGDSNSDGNILNTGTFENVGNTTLSGTILFKLGSAIDFHTTPKFNSGASFSGTSITPSIKINPNLVSAPSGGAIEYSRGQFFATNELTGTPTRALINQTYSYIAPNDFVFPFTINTPYLFLGTTGIYLSTGVYDIKYNFSLKKGATAPVLSVGLTGDGIQKFNYRHGLLSQRASALDVSRSNIIGDSLDPSLAFSGIGAIITATVPNKYEFNAVINVTGSNMKIRPFIYSSTASASGSMTGMNFDMQVTTLSSGSGINDFAMNGPWTW